MIDYFEFNGEKSSAYGLIVSNVTVYGAPSRKVQKFSVPGRNGDIIINSPTFENYIQSYEVAIVGDFREKARKVSNWLLKYTGGDFEEYGYLSDSFNPGTIRRAYCYSSIEYVTTMLNRYGRATIQFDCRPERYLEEGLEDIIFESSPGILNNPTGMIALPFFTVYGNGKLTVGDVDVIISGNPEGEPLYIDCENMMATNNDGANMNCNIEVDDFPALHYGQTAVYFDDGMTVSVSPGWWTL